MQFNFPNVIYVNTFWGDASHFPLFLQLIKSSLRHHTLERSTNCMPQPLNHMENRQLKKHLPNLPYPSLRSQSSPHLHLSNNSLKLTFSFFPGPNTSACAVCFLIVIIIVAELISAEAVTLAHCERIWDNEIIAPNAFFPQAAAETWTPQMQRHQQSFSLYQWHFPLQLKFRLLLTPPGEVWWTKDRRERIMPSISHCMCICVRCMFMFH